MMAAATLGAHRDCAILADFDNDASAVRIITAGARAAIALRLGAAQFFGARRVLHLVCGVCFYGLLRRGTDDLVVARAGKLVDDLHNGATTEAAIGIERALHALGSSHCRVNWSVVHHLDWCCDPSKCH